MKFFQNAANKVKNLFVEEVVETDKNEIKKDVIRVEIPAPESRNVQPVKVDTPSVVETPVENIPTEPIRREVIEPVVETPRIETPTPVEPRRKIRNTSLFFSDDDFDVLEKPKTRVERIKEEPKKVQPVAEPPKKQLYNGSKRMELEPPRTFKPTPIISPVWGILDQNYRKEDINIIDKGDRIDAAYRRKTVVNSDNVITPAPKPPKKEITLDEIREKLGVAEPTVEENIPEVEPEVIRSDDALEDDIFKDLHLNDNSKLDDDEEPISITNLLDSFDDNFVDVDNQDNMIEQELSRSYDEELPEPEPEISDEEMDDIDDMDDDIDELDDLDLSANDFFNLVDATFEKRDDMDE